MVTGEDLSDDNFWAFETMADLSLNRPDLCWELIAQILHASS